MKAGESFSRKNIKAIKIEQKIVPDTVKKNSPQKMGTTLDASLSTAKNHVVNILRKINRIYGKSISRFEISYEQRGNYAHSNS